MTKSKTKIVAAIISKALRSLPAEEGNLAACWIMELQLANAALRLLAKPRGKKKKG